MLCSVLSPIRKNNLSSTVIAVKTDWGSSLGMGHIQRMTSLLRHLNSQKNIKAYLVAGTLPRFFPENLTPYAKKKIGADADLVIRDMRDSSSGEIKELRKICPVIVIDDNGSGRHEADYRIDFLPNPVHQDSDLSGCFIYGYNFISSLEKIKEGTITKDIDFSIYTGSPEGAGHKEFILSLLPKDARTAVLGGETPVIRENGKECVLNDRSYSEIILSSKVIISHFGITLYEANISGCKPVSVNPGQYHHSLSEMAKDKLNLLNLGVSDKIDVKDARLKLADLLQETGRQSVRAGDVYREAADNLDRVFAFIKDNINPRAIPQSD